MCNISAYVGDRPATPILIEMMRRQEGLNGGFFSGITTIDNGEIRLRKCCGDLEHLLKTTDVASLGGKIGLAHSRTPGGHYDRWAHPFTAEKEGRSEIAIVINGAFLTFKDRTKEYVELAKEILSEGYPLSATAKDGVSDLMLPEGAVHACDLMCQLIMRNMDKGKDENTAITDAFCEMPAEIVALMLSRKFEDRIFLCRVSMPMFIAFAPHGVYMASSPTAFPEDAGEPIIIPPLTSGYVEKDGYHLSNFGERFPKKVLPLDVDTLSKVYSLLCEAMKKEPQTVASLAKLVRETVVADHCIPAAVMVYSTLYSLKKQGRLKVEHVRVPGATEKLTAPQYNLSIID